MENYNICSGALPEIWPNAAPTTKSVTPKSSNTTLVTKSKTPKSTNGARAVESDSPTSPNACHKKIHRFLSWLLLYCSFSGWPAPFLNYSIPFLNLSFTLLSFPLLDISLTEHSFLNCSFTELAFDELCLYCTLLLPNYSSTELVLSWTIPLLNYALFLPFKSS